MNRRAFIRGAVIAASTPASISIAGYDPLLNAIRAYRDGLIEFNRLAKESDDDERWNEFSEATYLPWQNKLDAWDAPAQTRESAIEALQAALDDDHGLRGTPAMDRMIKAAIGYLETITV